MQTKLNRIECAQLDVLAKINLSVVVFYQVV